MSIHCLSRTILAAGLAICQMAALAAGAPTATATPTSAPTPAAAEAVEQLIQKDLTGVPTKEVLMLTVEYLPGGASLPHRHDAQVFVYVLEGELRMQVAGSPEVTLRAGQTFYESPSDVHVVSANASKTMPAKILVFMLKDKHAPASRDAKAKATP
jgi:quercetin dioxygenase-like cupin family protein